MNQLHNRMNAASMQSSAAFAIIGFIVVACALSTNNIVARANAGEVPSFSLAFFRWMFVAFGLAPFAVREFRQEHGRVALPFRGNGADVRNGGQTEKTSVRANVFRVAPKSGRGSGSCDHGKTLMLKG